MASETPLSKYTIPSFWNLINDNFARCIPRLHFGMKFSPIKFLDPIHVERIFRKCNVDSGLIVEEVYAVHCFLLSYTLYAFSL